MLRNPIQSTADRPFPLPDRILEDGWWLTAAPMRDGGPRRGWVASSREGTSERDRSESEGQRNVART
jgi:hypothetical protein